MKCILRQSFTLLFVLLLTSCAAPTIKPEMLDYRTRAETQVNGKVSVSAVVLSPQEAKGSFSLPLAKEGIQPVWIEINNQEDTQFFLMLLSIEPNYYTPSEIAWMFRAYSNTERHEKNRRSNKISVDDMTDTLLHRHVPIIIPPHSTVSGYVYTHTSPGSKAFAIL